MKAAPQSAIAADILLPEVLARGEAHPSIEMSVENLNVCKDYCGSCPSYPGVKGEALFCATGASARAATVERKGCNCMICPLYEKCARSSTAYFCITGACQGAAQDAIREDDYEARFRGAPSVALQASSPMESAAGLVQDLRIEFQGDCAVQGEATRTLLEISLEAGIPHTHVCGGRARCSTCRVIVIEGVQSLAPRNEAEARLAEKKGFPPEVRLACQTRPLGNLTVRRLVYDDQDIASAMRETNRSLGEAGREIELSVLFSDIRQFTNFSESSLPYDVVHILNKYFESIGQIIDRHGGYIDKYLGDGIMVLFGLQEDAAVNHAAAAVRAAAEIVEALDQFNVYLKEHFGHQFRIGVGVHSGPAVVGSIGYSKKRQYTAIGDTVNTASRIESLTKKAGARVLVSEAVRRRCGDGFPWGRIFETQLRGKSERSRLFELRVS